MTTDDQALASAAAPLPLESVDTSPAMRNYVVLALGILFGFGVVPWVHGLGLVVMLWGVVHAYRLRADKSADGLLAAHGSWMVRTFWIAALYGLIAIVIAGFITSVGVDRASVEALAGVAGDGASDPAKVGEAFVAYFKRNEETTRMVTLICFVPIGFFAAVRCIIGYRHAYKGEKPLNLKTWLVR